MADRICNGALAVKIVGAVFMLLILVAGYMNWSQSPTDTSEMEQVYQLYLQQQKYNGKNGQAMKAQQFEFTMSDALQGKTNMLEQVAVASLKAEKGLKQSRGMLDILKSEAGRQVLRNPQNGLDLNRGVERTTVKTTIPTFPTTTPGAKTTKTPLAVSSASTTTSVVPSWISQCTDVYIDLGSNVGVQIRKIFEPEKYPQTHRDIIKLYDQEFGAPVVRKQPNSGLCAFGFEPNPIHQKKLHKIETAYAAKGWKVKFFPFAVSNSNGTVKFWTETNSPYQDWGATLYKVKGEAQDATVDVTQFRIADFLKIHFPARQIKVMKFDVEGAEYEILTDFLLEDLLCQNRVKIMVMEWHQYILKTRIWNKFYKSHQDILKLINSQKCTPTEIAKIDDESYLHDQVPL